MAKRAATLDAFLALARQPGRSPDTTRGRLDGPPLRVIGIDPGSRITGWGIVEARGAQRHHIASGTIRCADGPLPERLRRIFDEIEALIVRHDPQAAAVEQVFVRRNAGSSLVLGQARGAALCALAGARLPVAEYTPATIKSVIVGHGRAEKAQVQYMVAHLLKLPVAPAADAADALAIALCHLQQPSHGKIDTR